MRLKMTDKLNLFSFCASKRQSLKTDNMKKFLLSFSALLILTNLTHAQSFNPTLAAQLQNTIDSMKLANNIKGISACVIYPGQGTWKGVTGISYTGFPITSDMEFGIASNTKLFTGVLILKLAQNNIINLDDSLYEWLPNFTNIDSNITIRQLLNHTSGLADVNSVVGYSDSILTNPNRIYTPTELMTWVGTPLFAPGTSWSYSNTNYLLAGMIAESSTGQSYGQLLHDSILTPLQLDSTFLDVYDSVLYTIAHRWQSGIDNSTMPTKSLNSASWSAGGMYSTSGEMAQWYQALMSGQILNQNSFNEMTTFVGSGNYGVGLFETSILGRTVWQHGGTIWGGYNSTMMYDTTTNAIICVLINQNPAQAFLVAKQLLSTLINFPVGINENAQVENSFTIYPNPFSTQTVLQTAFPVNNATLTVDNIFGQTVAQIKNISGQTITFNRGNLPSGLYFVRLTQDNKIIAVDKLVITD